MKTGVPRRCRPSPGRRYRGLILGRRNLRGAAAVELALLLPFLLVITFGIIDFARATHFDNILIHLSREGANLAARTLQPRQNIIRALSQTAEPLDIQRNGMIHITTVVGLPNGMGQIQEQARSANGDQNLRSRLFQCPAWNADNTCQIGAGQGPEIDLGVMLVAGEQVQAVEAQYDYQMLINFLTDQGPDLYAITVL